jgi:hypothetical protein
MLAALLFVVGPLQATGLLSGDSFGFAFALVLMAAVFIETGSALAVGMILTAMALVVAATILRLEQPLDLYLDATAWMIAGVTLSIIASRAVFARGKVNVSSGPCFYPRELAKLEISNFQARELT